MVCAPCGKLAPKEKRRWQMIRRRLKAKGEVSETHYLTERAHRLETMAWRRFVERASQAAAGL